MRSTAIDRRTFLALAGAAALAPETALAGGRALFLGARLNGPAFEAAIIDERGIDQLVIPLEARGHSFAIHHESRRAVAFARAPGRFAIGFSVDGGDDPVAFAAPADRHFFGHGIFTPDARLLVATENDYEAGRGVLGIYDVANGYARIGEVSSDGIEPHEAVLLGDGRTLCVANGGILTHPDYDGVKLNIATMKPSLAYVDIETGNLVEKAELAPDLHRLSIRHLAMDAAGDVWFGCQYQGDPADRPPLVGRHRRGRDIELFPGPQETLRAFRNYVGSVAVYGPGEVLATSSPHGGVIAFWDTATGRCLGTRELADGCGIAPLARNELLATSGRGAIVEAGPGSSLVVQPAGGDRPAWDNHLRRV